MWQVHGLLPGQELTSDAVRWCPRTATGPRPQQRRAGHSSLRFHGGGTYVGGLRKTAPALTAEGGECTGDKSTVWLRALGKPGTCKV